MMCQWESVCSILPTWLRKDVDELGRESLQELRLRINAPPELNLGTRRKWLTRPVMKEDILFCINTASRYSPWSSSSISQGYLTVSGGHRIGLCGECICKEESVSGIREVSSLNIRIARDFPGIADAIVAKESLLILGAPGWGKTTLLRDLSRKISQNETVSVVDQRGEVFPEGMTTGKSMDILSGCGKAEGVRMLLRSMGPQWIVLDEITAPEDMEAVIEAQGCGVKLLATAHASSIQDLHRRPAYRRLLDQGIFQTFVVLRPDKSYRTERMTL